MGGDDGSSFQEYGVIHYRIFSNDDLMSNFFSPSVMNFLKYGVIHLCFYFLFNR